MNCIVVDDESLSLQFMTRALGAYVQITSLHAFENAAQALTFARGNPVDIAFLDIEMAELNGIELGRQLRGLHPDIYLVFVTAHAQYAVDAFGVRGNGYLLKPAHPNRIREEVEAAQKQLGGAAKRIRATTFGNFDVFVDDAMVKFPNARAKELLAYLIDRRGASVSAEEAISVLWEDRPHDSLAGSVYRKTLTQLRRNLTDAGIGDLLIDMRNQRSVNVKLLDCDYYRFLEGDPRAIRAYNGEYMRNYSWGEETNAMLTMRSEKLRQAP